MKQEISKMLAADKHGSFCHLLLIRLILLHHDDAGITF
jgi:hypothetical protein